MSEYSGSQAVPPVLRDRIRDEDSRLIERLVVLLLAFWMGGLLLVSIGATASFSAVQSTMDRPAASVTKAMAKLGIDQTRELLHYQSSEVNRRMFEIWGWLQLGLLSSVLAALLFMTNTGKRLLMMAAGMAGMAILIALFLIPGMIRIGREMRAGPLGPTPDMAESFKMMHQVFGAFEAATVVLALLLMALLLRGGARARR